MPEVISHFRVSLSPNVPQNNPRPIRNLHHRVGIRIQVYLLRALLATDARQVGRAEPARYQHAGRTECFFDDTQIELSGSSFEGAAINYEGHLALSWQVLLSGPF